VIGGLALLPLRDGPYLRKRAAFDPSALLRVFQHAPFRHTAFAYFGHMWELYALWALAGAYLSASLADDPAWQESVPLICFALVAAGALGCAGGGWLSRTWGERRVAMVALAVSCCACLLSGPMAAATPPLLVAFLLIWGVAVVADSPQFSALAARHAPPQYTATALTVQNGLGFAVTVVSLQLLPVLAEQVGWKHVLAVLAIGPLLGLLSLRRVPAR
jgi:MFS family permease